MKTKSKEVIIKDTPENVFAYMDNISKTGMHMTKSSMPMLGSRLELQQLSENNVGPGATYRWHGNMVGVPMDFTVRVTKWIEGREKIWETIGEAKMIIMKWYRMHLIVQPDGQFTRVMLEIDYLTPDNNLLLRFISFFLAPLYANWCLKNMLRDSKVSIEDNQYASGIY